METRDEILKAGGARYRSGSRSDKSRILTKFAKITGYHRKHAQKIGCSAHTPEQLGEEDRV